MKTSSLIVLLLMNLAMKAAVKDFEKDTIATSKGPLIITFIGHGTLMFEFGGKVIHVDPVSQEADYSTLPSADIILVTHHHSDHFDRKVIEKISKPETKILLTGKCEENSEDLNHATVLQNGESIEPDNIRIEAVPAYNIVHKRANGDPFHIKGEGNGYVITFGDKRVYVAGDTENIPEMKDLKNIDIAFLPMNLPYTMTPEMVADAVKSFHPAVLYPYHFGDTDTDKIAVLLKDEPVEVRIRKMK